MQEAGDEEEAPPAYTTAAAAPPPPAATTTTSTSTPSNTGSSSNNDPNDSRSQAGGGRCANVKMGAQGAGKWLMKVAKIVRSVGGLIFLLLAYTFLGAWIMVKIEGPAEDAQQKEVFNIRENIASHLKNNTVLLRGGLMNDSEWDVRMEDLLLRLETTVHSSGVTSTSKKKWTFSGGVLFCVTTYTTIGYGNIAPATKGGRVATMLYATIGIPLALMVLADLGRRITLVLKFLWGFIRRYYYTGYCKRARRKRGREASYDMTAATTVEGGLDATDGLSSLQREGSYRKIAPGSDNFYVQEETDVGVGGGGGEGGGGGGEGGGEGDGKTTTPTQPPRPGGSRVIGGDGGMQVALRKNAMDRSSRQASVERSTVSLASRTSHGGGTATPSGSHLTISRHDSPADVRFSADNDPNNKAHHKKASSVFIDEAQLKEEFQLPVAVAVGFIFAYIFLGAGMYKLWEDWTYLESFYFVFITVSTIGYGDVLPDHPNFFLLSCVYTFLGLSLVSMTINVIGEFMSETIDRAKEKVDQAADRAVAKAKAAKGKLTAEVEGAIAKHKIGKKNSRDGSVSPSKLTKKSASREGSLSPSNNVNNTKKPSSREGSVSPSKLGPTAKPSSSRNGSVSPPKTLKNLHVVQENGKEGGVHTSVLPGDGQLPLSATNPTPAGGNGTHLLQVRERGGPKGTGTVHPDLPSPNTPMSEAEDTTSFRTAADDVTASVESGLDSQLDSQLQ